MVALHDVDEANDFMVIEFWGMYYFINLKIPSSFLWNV